MQYNKYKTYLLATILLVSQVQAIEKNYFDDSKRGWFWGEIKPKEEQEIKKEDVNIQVNTKNTDKKIVPDEKDEIAGAVRSWCEEGYNLVLTTGGTGLSPRDVTPEALLGVADKIVPGFGEMMRMKTLEFTERAFLTRSVAVICNKTLVIAFPGSQRGARQCFEAIVPALRHGIETLAGWDSECGGHSHRH